MKARSGFEAEQSRLVTSNPAAIECSGANSFEAEGMRCGFAPGPTLAAYVAMRKTQQKTEVE